MYVTLNIGNKWMSCGASLLLMSKYKLQYNENIVTIAENGGTWVSEMNGYFKKKETLLKDAKNKSLLCRLSHAQTTPFFLHGIQGWR